jgi:hypothetical protein
VTVPVRERSSWRSVGYAIEDLARHDRRVHDAIEDLF